MDMAIFEDGRRFFVGCNYWASHAGTNMWRDWSAESVEADFAANDRPGSRCAERGGCGKR